MADWGPISSLATAGGTLVLAAATFASVRSSNRSARLAEEALLAQNQPLLMPSRLDDPPVKVGFADDHFVRVEGGRGTAEATADAVYLTISLRNVGHGIAVLHGWRFDPARTAGEVTSSDRPDVDSFRRLTRDLYISGTDVAFWQGAIRDVTDPEYHEIATRIKERERILVDVLYGDYRGGQRIITRFSLLPARDDVWLATVSRHWNIDRPDPR